MTHRPGIVRRQLLQGAIGTVATLALPARARAFPNKPITFILPFPAGGSFDFIARPMGAGAFRQYAVAQVAREKTMLDKIGFKPE